MRTFNSLMVLLFSAAIFTACKGDSGKTKKGSDLKGEDALSYLVGKERKYWQLDEGHDYYEYIQFEPAGKGLGPKGTDFTYTVKDDEILLKDFINTKFKIVEVSNDKLVVISPEKETLTYLYIEPGTSLAKEKPFLEVNPKWLKGKYGTTWKFSEGGKMYSYMNDGSIIDAATLRKIATWKVADKTLYFGDNSCSVSRLSPVFFDYDAMGIPVKMNYYSEANADGTPVKKNY